ncbi:MAG: hypothetical protein H6686_13065 [Fibrobacteria bacterium]|nr:hypothetical protein [Fibrobacteria bacterium]
MHRIPFSLVLVASGSVVLQGCLATVMRLEDGTILPPGSSDFALATGKVDRTDLVCPDPTTYLEVPDAGSPSCVGRSGWTYEGGFPQGSSRTLSDPRVVSHREAHFGLVWRLGALGPFGPFTGLELGMQSEVATYPATQEFRLALGLPGSDSVWAQSLLAGWGIGMWADNSWFLQYALSRRWGDVSLFGSWRSTLQATSMQDVMIDGSFQHERTWEHQLGGGARYRLGEAPVLPDWLQCAATLNLVHQGYPEDTRFRQPEGTSLVWTLAWGWRW